MVYIAVIGVTKLTAHLQASAARITNLKLVEATTDQLLDKRAEPPDVVLVGMVANLVSDVSRLCHADYSVLVVAHGSDPGVIVTLLAAGACVLSGRDQPLSALATVISSALENISHAGDAERTSDPVATERHHSPRLSDRELAVLRAYTSGLTLDAVARSLGIQPNTAKTYIKRIKEKYQKIGRPVYTKLEMASRVAEDNLSADVNICI